MEGFFFLLFVGLIFLAINLGRKQKLNAQKMAEYHTELNKKIKIINKKREEKKKAFEGQEVKMADKYEKYVLEMVEKHKFALLADRKKLVTKDSYGVPIDNGWVTSKGKKLTGIDYFDNNVLIPVLDEKFKDIISPSEVYYDKGRERQWLNKLLIGLNIVFANISLGT